MGRWERVSGLAGKDPQEAFGKDGLAMAKFSICCDDWDEGKAWYNVLVRGPVAEFVMKNIRKGMRIMVEGSVVKRAYTNRDGKAAIDQSMKATRVAVPGGPEASEELVEGEEQPIGDQEEVLLRKKVAQNLTDYPIRWNRPGWRLMQEVAGRPVPPLSPIPDPNDPKPWGPMPDPDPQLVQEADLPS